MSNIKIIESEPREIYKCNCCGITMRRPAKKPFNIEEYYDEESLCTACGSDDLSYSDVKCKKCGEWLFGGEDAYQIGDDVYCTSCVTPVEI